MTLPVYRPILLTRNGELQAVSDLAEPVSAAFAPVFAVHRPRDRSLADHLDSVAAKGALRVPGPTVAVDTSFIDEHHDVVAHPLLCVSEKDTLRRLPRLVERSRSARSRACRTSASRIGPPGSSNPHQGRCDQEHDGPVTAMPLEEDPDAGRLAARVERSRHRVTLTRGGEPVAVVISAEELSGLEDTVEMLRDPAEAAALDEGLADIEARRLHEEVDVLTDLRRRRDGT